MRRSSWLHACSAGLPLAVGERILYTSDIMRALKRVIGGRCVVGA